MNRLAEINVAVITISDRSFRNERPDLSGPALINYVKSLGWKVDFYEIVSDDLELIEKALRKAVADLHVDLILTTGGTGLATRDNTPEATQRVIEKSIPGLAEYMRQVGFSQNPNALLSRAVTGMSNGKLIINLPGSPNGAINSLQSIVEVIPHAIGIINNLELH